MTSTSLEIDSPEAAALRVARAFVAARVGAVPVAEFPGALPASMAGGYAIQEAAIGLWQDGIAGWKVGLVSPSFQAQMGTTRLAGPIFSRNVALQPAQARSGAAPVRFGAIAGGFAAIEVELVAAVATDAPPEKTQWSLEEAAALVGDWHLGVEFAASPLATINDLGPTVVVSDFGNNSGLIVGPRLEGVLAATPTQLICRVSIDKQPVGLAAAVAGEALESVRFLAGHLASRGRPLRAGQWVSTGAITGVHRIFPGQEASAELVGRERIDVMVGAASP